MYSQVSCFESNIREKTYREVEMMGAGQGLRLTVVDFADYLLTFP